MMGTELPAPRMGILLWEPNFPPSSDSDNDFDNNFSSTATQNQNWENDQPDHNLTKTD
jgi:hypothetical protein